MFKNLQPANIFAKDMATQLGVKPHSISQQINRNINELIEKGVVFKTKGKNRLVDPEKFMNWYLNH